jgi:hypothetical protein
VESAANFFSGAPPTRFEGGSLRLSGTTVRYQPYYCEENVWHLCGDPSLPAGDRFALFISSEARQTPLFAQRAGDPGRHGFCAWDYHVVLLLQTASRPAQIWDLDTTLGAPVPLERYLRETFRLRTLSASHAPRFRLIPAELFLRTFSCDRSHMRSPEGWSAPPPPWPPILDPAGSMNLFEFVEMGRPFHGEVLDLPGLEARFKNAGDD